MVLLELIEFRRHLYPVPSHGLQSTDPDPPQLGQSFILGAIVEP